MSITRTICTQFLGVLCWPCYAFAICVCPTYVEEDPESQKVKRDGFTKNGFGWGSPDAFGRTVTPINSTYPRSATSSNGG
ncbi:hypothetical protein SNOG_01673 [Parastagonospora nodorum SN15]|uniref:Uncharacterized protein n=1 Tax=Phaeosphaeria nodorum (strain SN15 / ATCC MYA-4574 / FGSC 10173) TaxID=321614 RepID=Q0V2U1_PHANO|nr:hypothetical protein SNOG_01673 [Parastagonospora nodorum SN15]EAT91322.1 hypothetical protein SNOG_01673 [Parastagonospora nodorum SN15]